MYYYLYTKGVKMIKDYVIVYSSPFYYLYYKNKLLDKNTDEKIIINKKKRLIESS